MIWVESQSRRRSIDSRVANVSGARPPWSGGEATIASLAGFEPRIAHRADSLELVQELADHLHLAVVAVAMIAAG